MNSSTYIDWMMSANDSTAELARIGTSIEDFEKQVQEIKDVEWDHLYDDAMEAKWDSMGENVLDDDLAD
jgi:hypothetical protein